jgi:hypothetical protein
LSLRSPWIAIEAGANVVAQQRSLRRVHEGFFSDPTAPGQRPAELRSVIAASWRRCRRAGLEPETPDWCAPFALDGDALAEQRLQSGLESAVPVLRDLLGAHARDSHHLLIVTNADGHLLWVEGDHSIRRKAEEVALTPGAFWREDVAGTNAMGTSIAVDHAVQVFSAEHVRAAVHGWTCSAAPLHDPQSGAIIGSVDLTGPANTVHPHSLALVEAAARSVKALLVPANALAASTLHLRALGTDRLGIALGERTLTLSPRHSEIVVLLVAHAHGLSPEQLALELFGEHGKPATVRAELSRLRRLLGPALDADPYRLTVPIQADFLEVERSIEAGRAGAALAGYPGRLLPRSQAPGIAELRNGLDAGVRGIVLSSGDDALLRRWLESPAGRDDLPGLQLLLRRRPRDASLALLGRRAARLRAELV